MTTHLVSAIEKKLDWGNGDTWTNKDFEALSERILKSTNKRLSVTTLKRIWGRAEQVANPSMATLDILSEYLGHENWRAFVRVQEQATVTNKIPPWWNAKIGYGVLGLLVFGGLLSFFMSSSKKGTEKVSYDPGNFSFTSRPVSNDIPNSVVFEYDAAAAPKNAKIEIQQSWDRRKRIKINREDSIATCIYYRPGFFKSKLVINDSVVKEKDVFITSQDWLGMIDRDSVPIYLKNEEIFTNGSLGVGEATLSKYGIDPGISRTRVSLHQVRDFGELYTNDFEFKTVLQNQYNEGINACQGTLITLLYDGGAIVLTLADKGCVAELNLMAFDRYIDGSKTDLSAFGVDFSTAARVQCISKNQKLSIFVNGHVAYELKVPEIPKKIIGFRIQFDGAGMVEQVVLRNQSRVLYTTNFTKYP